MYPKFDKRPYTTHRVTREQLDAILDDVARGAPIVLATMSNGVCEKTYYNYVNQGSLDIASGDSDTLHAIFVKRLHTIYKEEVIKLRAMILGSEKSHRGAEWVLERGYQKLFGNDVALKELEQKVIELESVLEEAKLKYLEFVSTNQQDVDHGKNVDCESNEEQGCVT